MKENMENPAMLDQALAQMAQETPEMPADFHDRWTSAIRAEAAKKQQTEEALPLSGTGSNSGAKTAGGRQESRRQWRYILSAAAVFVFLIGGTLLTRNTDKTNLQDSAAGGVQAPAVQQTLAPEAFAANGVLSVQEQTVPEAGLYMDAEAATEETDLAADSSELQNAAKYSMNADAVSFSEEAEIPDELAGKAAGAAMEKTESAPAAAAAADEAEAAEELFFEEAAEEPAAEKQEEPAQKSEFVSFLKDLGIFTLKTLAAAAAAAALAFGAAAVHKALKKRKSS